MSDLVEKETERVLAGQEESNCRYAAHHPGAQQLEYTPLQHIPTAVSCTWSTPTLVARLPAAVALCCRILTHCDSRETGGLPTVVDSCTRSNSVCRDKLM